MLQPCSTITTLKKIPKRNCSNFRHLVVHAIIFKMVYELMY